MSATQIDLEFGKFYVVEVSFFKNNPIHRAIAYGCRRDGITLIGNGYECPMHAHPEQLPWFRVVEEIAAMDLNYPNHFLLPHEARAALQLAENGE